MDITCPDKAHIQLYSPLPAPSHHRRAGTRYRPFPVRDRTIAVRISLTPNTTSWIVAFPRLLRVDMYHVMTNALDITFAALADSTRRAILTMLLEDDMAVTDVAEPFEMSLAAVSKHLSILTRAGLIAQEKRGRVKWCKLEPDAMKNASVWMQGFGQFEPVNLDAFERFLKEELDQSQ